MIIKLLQRTVQYSIIIFNQQKTIPIVEQFIRFSSKTPNKTLEPNSKESSFMDSTTTEMIDNDFEIRSKAHRICKDHLGGAWGKISSSDMSLLPIR